MRAYAKVNLALDVLRRRSDGYHDIDSIMQTIDLYDLVRLQIQPAGITVTCDHPEVPGGEDNLAARAARMLFQEAGKEVGVTIGITKHIPVAAGLGGGSSDAAAVLLGLNYLLELGLVKAQLMAIGARLGADVPYCLMGGTARAQGIGEKLTPLPPAPELWLVLAKPSFGVSTAEVYGNLDLNGPVNHPPVDRMAAAIRQQDRQGMLSAMGNTLEAVTMARYPAVADLKQEMLVLGALQSVMCGSGPTVCGVARDREHARTMARILGGKGLWTVATKTH